MWQVNFVTGLSRLLKPKKRAVYLNGATIHGLAMKDLAKALGILPQNPHTLAGLTVYGLVTQGRYPYQGFFKQ